MTLYLTIHIFILGRRHAVIETDKWEIVLGRALFFTSLTCRIWTLHLWQKKRGVVGVGWASASAMSPLLLGQAPNRGHRVVSGFRNYQPQLLLFPRIQKEPPLSPLTRSADQDLFSTSPASSCRGNRKWQGQKHNAINVYGPMYAMHVLFCRLYNILLICTGT